MEEELVLVPQERSLLLSFLVEEFFGFLGMHFALLPSISFTPNSNCELLLLLEDPKKPKKEKHYSLIHPENYNKN